MDDAVTTDGSSLGALCADLMDADHALLTRAQAGGVIRPDVTWPDVYLDGLRAASAPSPGNH